MPIGFIQVMDKENILSPEVCPTHRRDCTVRNQKLFPNLTLSLILDTNKNTYGVATGTATRILMLKQQFYHNGKTDRNRVMLSSNCSL